jgi:hypothetical protein
MLRALILFNVILLCACQAKPEQAQRHHNQIMVAQHRVVSAFDQLDSSIYDSTGYRLLYWEYDSVAWHLLQMTQLLDTIQPLKNDSNLIHSARAFTTTLKALHQHEYPLFLDSFRKFSALGQPVDSIDMCTHQKRIENEKSAIITKLREDQNKFVEKYNLTILDNKE